MKSKALEVVRGSGNVFRDFKKSSPDADQLKAILAAEIIKKLDRDGLTVRDAQTRTGVAAADSHGFATPTSVASPLTASCRSSTDSDQRSKCA